jgi:hypothetical protein
MALGGLATKTEQLTPHPRHFGCLSTSLGYSPRASRMRRCAPVMGLGALAVTLCSKPGNLIYLLGELGHATSNIRMYSVASQLLLAWTWSCHTPYGHPSTGRTHTTRTYFPRAQSPCVCVWGGAMTRCEKAGCSLLVSFFLVAYFLLAPWNDWNRGRESGTETRGNMAMCTSAPSPLPTRRAWCRTRAACGWLGRRLRPANLGLGAWGRGRAPVVARRPPPPPPSLAARVAESGECRAQSAEYSGHT